MSYAHHSGLGQASADDQDLANQAGIPLRILLAIRRVESAGRVHATRFEPHVFHRDTDGRFTRAQVPWTPGGRPGKEAVSYVPSETNRAAFERAFRLSPADAVRSTSWGAYQVMGRHLLSATGLEPAQAVAAFDADPAGVGRRMFISWMNANPRAREAAQAGNIERLASIYNGSQDWAAAVRRALSSLPEQIAVEAGAAVAAHPVAAMSMATVAGVVTVVAAGAFVWWAYRRSRSVRRNRRRRRRSRASGSLQPNAEPTDPALYSRIQRSVRESVKRWPSAYASGLVVQRYKAAGGEYDGRTRREGGLAKWFAEKWVDVCDPSLPPCGRATSGMSEREYRKKYPKCRPLAVAKKMSAPERAAACARKRRAVSKAGPRVVWVRN